MKKKILVLSLGIFIILNLVIVSAAQCNDGLDNDLDGKIDFPDDDGCDKENDRTESLKLGYADGCFSRGEVLTDVFGNINYECGGTSCFTCVLMTEAGNYSTIFSRCKDLPRCGFSEIVGNTEIDLTSPELVINSPVQEGIYDSRKVLFDLTADETVSLYYIDNVNGKGRWKRLSRNVKSYFKSLNFKDGLNDITIWAFDKNDNEVFVDRQFYVDSKDPRIKKTYPKRGFANGIFEVEFKESNPESLILNYGNNEMGFMTSDVILNECSENRNKINCDVQVDLNEFDGKEIEYWFELTDIAGNIDDSKKISLDVDITSPVILNRGSFWNQGDGRKNKYIYFDMIIDENNFDDATYIDNDSSRPREKRICSRLKDGRCIKRATFKKGHHSVDVQITDEAGNAISERIEFDVL